MCYYLPFEKLGGQNSLLVDEQKKQLPLISDVPSLIIGADISHSRVGEDGPSISSVSLSPHLYLVNI
jgi:eukaryotic translation initiation factor 2C